MYLKVTNDVIFKQPPKEKSNVTTDKEEIELIEEEKNHEEEIIKLE